MADETAKLLGNKGQVAIIVNQEFGAFPIPYLDIEMQVFTNALKQKGITLAEIEKVEMQKVGLARPQEAFLAAIEKQKNVDAIVSVVGFPMGPNQNPGDFRKYKPGFIVVAPYEPGLKRLLQDAIIRLAILPRFASPPTRDAPPAQAFDGGFELFTPQDAARLP